MGNHTSLGPAANLSRNTASRTAQDCWFVPLPTSTRTKQSPQTPVFNANMNFNEQTRGSFLGEDLLRDLIFAHTSAPAGVGGSGHFLISSALVVLHVCQDPCCWCQEACKHGSQRDGLLLRAGEGPEESVGWLHSSCNAHGVPRAIACCGI